jgi:hypothetical protein
MKNSKDTTILFFFQKYGKVLCLETILVFLLISCSQKVKGESSISGTIIIREDDVNSAMEIEFTPPPSADATTVINVMASVTLAEIGW